MRLQPSGRVCAAHASAWRRAYSVSSDVKITSVEVIPVCAPMAVGRGPSVLTYQRRETLFIKLVTDDGRVGWGETYRLAGVESALRDVLAPMLVGCDPLVSGRLHQDMLLATFHNGFAVGGIDIALHDLRGKALDIPVHALYGGALRDSVEAYASLPGYFEDQAPEDHWLEEADTLIAQGFHGLKFRIGRFSVEREARVLGQVRQAVGRDVRLMGDALEDGLEFGVEAEAHVLFADGEDLFHRTLD